MQVKQPAKIAVVGAGWWTQGWHLPQLDRNANADLVAIVQNSEQPSTKLGDLDSRTELSKKYNTKTFDDIRDLFADSELGPEVDGVLVGTQHATHFELGKVLLEEATRRLENGEKPLNIMMEKPMTADVEEAKKLHDLVEEYRSKGGKGAFLVNHSANFRDNAAVARNIVTDGTIGRISFISAFFASPIMSIFDDPDMKGWNEPTGNMIGNGFAWGQIAHMLGYIYHVCPDLVPETVFCAMTHSEKTGADIAHAATIICRDKDKKNVIMSLSGTALLPGGGKEGGSGKQVRVQIYGEKGAIVYGGDDSIPESGHMELRRVENDGKVEKPNGDGFYFENTEQEGDGIESLQNFIKACQGQDYYVGADSLLGLRTVQTIHAMYRSDKSFQPEKVEYTEVGSDKTLVNA